MRHTVTDTDAQKRLVELIQHADNQQDHYIAEHAGRPMAVLVPFEYYEKLRQVAKDRVFDMLDESWRRTAGVPNDELEADVVDALTRLREENRAYLTSASSDTPNR